MNQNGDSSHYQKTWNSIWWLGYSKIFWYLHSFGAGMRLLGSPHLLIPCGPLGLPLWYLLKPNFSGSVINNPWVGSFVGGVWGRDRSLQCNNVYPIVIQPKAVVELEIFFLYYYYWVGRVYWFFFSPGGCVVFGVWFWLVLDGALEMEKKETNF